MAAKTFRYGAVQALLWEQWKYTRVGLLLPLAVLASDTGLWLWCARLAQMPMRQFVDIADTYFVALSVAAGMLLLSQPDRKLVLTFTPVSRHLRLPVSPLLQLLVWLPLRLIVGGAAVALSLQLHHAIYGDFTVIPKGEGMGAFLVGFLLLFCVVNISNLGGNKAAVISIAVASGAMAYLGGPMLLMVKQHPVLSPLLALSAAVAAAGARRILRGYSLPRVPGANPLTRRSSHLSQLPLFRSPQQAQLWYERRRHGWLLPVASVLGVLGVAGFLQFSGYYVYRGNMDQQYHEWQRLFLLLPTVLLGASLVAAGAIAAWDYQSFRSAAGRFQMVRPFTPEGFASARYGMHWRALCTAGGWCMLLACALFVLHAVRYPREGYETWLEEGFYPSESGRQLLNTLAGVGLGILLIGGAWLVLISFNRVSMIVVGIGLALLLTWNKHLEAFAVAWVGLATLLNLAMAYRAGVLRLAPQLVLMSLGLLISAFGAVLPLDYHGYPWFIPLIAALLWMGALAAVPVSFHLRRSGSLLPLSEAPARRREIHASLLKLALVLLLCAPLYAGYRLSLEWAKDAQEIGRLAAQWADATTMLHPALHTEINRKAEEERYIFEYKLSAEDEERLAAETLRELPRLEEALQSEEPPVPPRPLADLLGVLERSVPDRLWLGLFLAAERMAASGDSDTALRCVTMALALEHAYGYTPGNRLLPRLERVLQAGGFREEQLSQMQRAVPVGVHPALLHGWVEEDLRLIERFGEGFLQYKNLQQVNGGAVPRSGEYFVLRQEPYAGWWYEVLGLRQLDQMAARQQLFDAISPNPLPVQFSYLLAQLPYTRYLLDNGHINYGHLEPTTTFYELARIAIATKRFALKRGQLPLAPCDLVPDYLQGFSFMECGSERRPKRQFQFKQTANREHVFIELESPTWRAWGFRTNPKIRVSLNDSIPEPGPAEES